VDAQRVWQAIKFADVALYQAKETGRNKIVRFENKMFTEEEF
jgi:PleD family two-component response regulator